MDFEFSAINLAGIRKSLDARKVTDELLPRLPPDARAALSAPNGQRWYPGIVMVQLWEEVARLRGWSFVEEVNHECTTQALGTLARPLIKVALALTNSSPASLFSRLGQLSGLALKHVDFDWAPAGDRAGVQTITYPSAVPAHVIDHLWRAVFRVGSDMTGATIRVERFEPRSDRSFSFHVAW